MRKNFKEHFKKEKKINSHKLATIEKNHCCLLMYGVYIFQTGTDQ